MITPDGEAPCSNLPLGGRRPGHAVCSTYRWTSAGGSEPSRLGAYGVSKDGQKVLCRTTTAAGRLLKSAGDTPVGAAVPFIDPCCSARTARSSSVSPARSPRNGAQRWSEAGGLEVSRSSRSPTWAGPHVRAINSDASSVVGYVESEGGDIPFRWTDAGGVETMGPIPEDAGGARPGAVSEDGSVVVGVTTVFAQNLMVFRWTSSSFQILAPAPPMAAPGRAYMEMTADGAVVTATIGYPNPS